MTQTLNSSGSSDNNLIYPNHSSNIAIADSASNPASTKNGFNRDEGSSTNSTKTSGNNVQGMALPTRKSWLSHPTSSLHRVCFIGAGYVGGPTAAVMALHNPHIRVDVVDRDNTRIMQWNSYQLPLCEPDLDEVVRIARDGRPNVKSETRTEHGSNQLESNSEDSSREPNLFFSTDISKAISQANIIFLAINTPTKQFGVGAGSATDMSMFNDAVEEVVRNARSGTIIVEKSTVPCGTAQHILHKFKTRRPGECFEVLSNPEFLAESSAIRDLMNPDRIIIGHDPTPPGLAAANMLSVLYSWVLPQRILLSNAWSAELSKLAANAMLAQRISSINSISAICEETGANISEVADAIGCDTRIGSRHLEAGVGFGGSCFRKDIASLVYLAESLALPEVAAYWSQVNLLNSFQSQRFARRVVRRLDNSLIGMKITILGFAFKNGTGDVRESPATEIIRNLSKYCPGEIAIFDPLCSMTDIVEELKGAMSDEKPFQCNFRVYESPYPACYAADAILIVTKCDQFQYRGVRADQKDLPYNTSSSHEEDAANRTTVSCGQYVQTCHTTRPTAAIDHVLGTLMDQQPAEVDRDHKPRLTLHTEPPNVIARPSISAYHRGSSFSAAFIDWPRVVQTTKRPIRIFDGRGVLDHTAIDKLAKDLDLEINLESIGVRSGADKPSSRS